MLKHTKEEVQKIDLNFPDYTEKNKSIFSIGKDFVKK
jgi:hypothetical protein